MLTDIKTDQLVIFNAFGVVTISPHAMSASVSACIGSRMISRSMIRNMDGLPPLPGMDSDETIAVSFGATLKQGERTHIAAYEIGKLRSGADVSDLPEVKKIVSEVLSQLKSALK